jgi:hypothetical protein
MVVKNYSDAAPCQKGCGSSTKPRCTLWPSVRSCAVTRTGDVHALCSHRGVPKSDQWVCCTRGLHEEVPELEVRDDYIATVQKVTHVPRSNKDHIWPKQQDHAEKLTDKYQNNAIHTGEGEVGRP